MGRPKLRPRRAYVPPPPTLPLQPTVRELAEEVEVCRRAQTVFARSRQPQDLARMRRLEAALDERVAGILARRELPAVPSEPPPAE